MPRGTLRQRAGVEQQSSGHAVRGVPFGALTDKFGINWQVNIGSALA